MDFVKILVVFITYKNSHYAIKIIKIQIIKIVYFFIVILSY